ncbi:MAG: hypothetical protein ACREV8_03085, partial [Gammaproteobacteria bacterium]
LKEIVIYANDRRHPHPSTVRAYRNANEIRARACYPLRVFDKPRAQPIRSAVKTAGGVRGRCLPFLP